MHSYGTRTCGSLCDVTAPVQDAVQTMSLSRRRAGELRLNRVAARVDRNFHAGFRPLSTPLARILYIKTLVLSRLHA